MIQKTLDRPTCNKQLRLTDFTCREGLCLPPSLDMADIFIETPAAYSIRYGDRDIDSAFLKVHSVHSVNFC